MSGEYVNCVSWLIALPLYLCASVYFMIMNQI